MSNITIKLTGVAAELVLGNYMPNDSTIYNDWEEFYQYNDLIHESQLLIEYISELEIKQDAEVIYSGKIPKAHIRPQKSFSPVLVNQALYLRTECAEQAVYQCCFQAEDFDKLKLFFETQDYDLLFKVGKSFLSNITYEGKLLDLEWISGKSVGNICLLCRFDSGYLVPVFDAIKKIS